MVQTMKTLLWISYFTFFTGSYSFAQPKKDIPYFSREIIFSDTLTLGILNHYIDKVPAYRVVYFFILAPYQMNSFHLYEPDFQKHIEKYICSYTYK